MPLHRIECNFTVSEMMFILMDVLSRLFYRYPPVLHPIKTSCASSGATFNYDYDGLNIQHGSAFALLIIYTNVIVYCMTVILLKCPNSNLLQSSLLLLNIRCCEVMKYDIQSVFAGCKIAAILIW